ncbi:Ethylene-responsive transcription factor RAP2-6 [Hordeum vulgare]|nr:Ethylene-responsive transcription factor RAP2-6 [Hordeum vulgare]
MAPRRRPSSGFFGVRERPSGRFATEITVDGVRWWIGTFDSAELVARAYNAATIRFGRPRWDLNFPDTDRDYALLLAPPLYFVDVTDEHEQRRERANLRAAQIDELRMETLHRDHPELVQAELDFFAGRKKKKAAAA